MIKSIILWGTLFAVVLFGQIMVVDSNFAIGIKKNPNFSDFIVTGDNSKNSFGRAFNKASVMYHIKSEMSYVIFATVDNKTLSFRKVRG